MGLATFIGGIHPYEGKELSEDKPIKVLEPLQGEIMVYPLSQKRPPAMWLNTFGSVMKIRLGPCPASMP